MGVLVAYLPIAFVGWIITYGPLSLTATAVLCPIIRSILSRWLEFRSFLYLIIETTSMDAYVGRCRYYFHLYVTLLVYRVTDSPVSWSNYPNKIPKVTGNMTSQCQWKEQFDSQNSHRIGEVLGLYISSANSSNLFEHTQGSLWWSLVSGPILLSCQFYPVRAGRGDIIVSLLGEWDFLLKFGSRPLSNLCQVGTPHRDIQFEQANSLRSRRCLLTLGMRFIYYHPVDKSIQIWFCL